MGFKVKDHYYKKAKKNNFLARSIYKLEEIDTKYQILKKGDMVIDLGYYPGSWIQYTSKKIGFDGHIVGVDIQKINSKLESIDNVTLFQKDIFNIFNVEEICMTKKADVVLSDMAPSTTGIKSVDQIKSLNLVEDVFNKLNVFLKPMGNIVIKVFDSNDAQEFLKAKRKHFKELINLRPKSTRSVSKEFFVIGKGYVSE